MESSNGPHHDEFEDGHRPRAEHKRHLIRGVEVEFPYEPYGCQMAFMSKVCGSATRRFLAIMTDAPSLLPHFARAPANFPPATR